MPEYSILQLGTFEECALQYWLIYVDRIKRYEEGVETFLGQRFHEAMEWLYRERAFRVIPLEELLAYYEKAWAEKWHTEVKINRKERSGDDYKLMGRRFIEDYYKRHHPFDEGRVLGLERYIRFPLAEGTRHGCKGIIDRIEAEREFAPHESALCNWCPYWDLCPVKKHLVKVEGLPPT